MICTVTPLYSFCSDLAELAIAGGIRISRCDPDPDAPPSKYHPWDTRDCFDEVVGNHLQICEPDYLLWYNPVLTQDIWLDDYARLLEGKNWSELGQEFLTATAQLFRLFRLFKPRRLRAGETFVIQFQRQDEYWETIDTGRAATTNVDYQRLALKSVAYEFSSNELLFFQTFKESLLPLLQQAEAVPALNLALNMYGADNGQELDAINTVTALEALLTKKDEKEGLTYRLSMRTANLLGRDPEARKKIFGEIKNFYNLRSTLVHGSQLDEKLQNRLNELGSLRETLRRVILSAIALLPEDYPCRALHMNFKISLGCFSPQLCKFWIFAIFRVLEKLPSMFKEIVYRIRVRLTRRHLRRLALERFRKRVQPSDHPHHVYYRRLHTQSRVESRCGAVV